MGCCLSFAACITSSFCFAFFLSLLSTALLFCFVSLSCLLNGEKTQDEDKLLGQPKSGPFFQSVSLGSRLFVPRMMASFLSGTGCGFNALRAFIESCGTLLVLSLFLCLGMKGYMPPIACQTCNCETLLRFLCSGDFQGSQGEVGSLLDLHGPPAIQLSRLFR